MDYVLCIYRSSGIAVADGADEPLYSWHSRAPSIGEAPVLAADAEAELVVTCLLWTTKMACSAA